MELQTEMKRRGEPCRSDSQYSLHSLKPSFSMVSGWPFLTPPLTRFEAWVSEGPSHTAGTRKAFTRTDHSILKADTPPPTGADVLGCIDWSRASRFECTDDGHAHRWVVKEAGM